MGMEIEIQSTRFGTLVVDDERIINFPNGLLGFPDHKRFALIQTGEENYFFWLQSVDEANLAFVITDPTIFFKGYEVPLRDETRQELRLEDAGDDAAAGSTASAETFLQVFVICNKVDDWLTGNLLGPLVRRSGRPASRSCGSRGTSRWRSRLKRVVLRGPLDRVRVAPVTAGRPYRRHRRHAGAAGAHRHVR
jgi:flagellar assembly factor FliW